MATTGKNFVSLNSGAVVLAVNPTLASALVSGASGVLLDKLTLDLATAAYAKNGAVIVALSVSTPVTVDLTALGSQPVNAGDTSFATVKQLIFRNLGGFDVTVSPGASNPFAMGLSGTGPAFTVPAGGSVTMHFPSAKTVDGTHKTILVDPGAHIGSVAVCVGGS